MSWRYAFGGVTPMLSVAMDRALGCLRERRRFPLSGWRRVLGTLYLLEYVGRMTLLDLQVRFGAKPSVAGPQRLTVVVPTYYRLANLRPIVRSALRLRFLERIVVVNGNPEVRVADWVPHDDERVVAIDDPGSGVGVRFSVALAYPSDYYITLDDDTLLRPDQLARLFRELVRDPQATHGIIGQRHTPSASRPFEYGVRSQEVVVDVLNTFHAFTRRHLERYHRNVEALGLPASREIHNGEDILMSLSGQARPRVHDVGRWIICPSAIDPAVAIHHRRASFQQERAELFERFRDALGHGH